MVFEPARDLSRYMEEISDEISQPRRYHLHRLPRQKRRCHRWPDFSGFAILRPTCRRFAPVDKEKRIVQWIAPSEKDTATDAIEKRLWDAVDPFLANSGLKSQGYFAPVLGLVFLRFAEVRFNARRSALTEQPSPGSASHPLPLEEGRGESMKFVSQGWEVRKFVDIITQQQVLIFQIQSLCRTRDLLMCLPSDQVELMDSRLCHSSRN